MDTKYMLPVGTLLNGGRYKIVKLLSSGGFGKTYVVEKVFHKGELYAIKEFFIKGINARHENTVIVSNDENEETFNHQKEKFLTEAERLRDVENKHIVRVHDFFSDNGTCYYVMDLIDGESLDTVKKPLKEEKVWDILDQVLDALSTIHQKKTIENKKERIWVHLDIKPANLMIDKNGKITLIDFGASKQLSAKGSNSSISMSQMSFTKGYAPIEQTSQKADSIGPWTDFYALGATLYKLLTEKDSVIPEYSELNDCLFSNDDISNAFNFPKNVSERMHNLIVWMMNPNRKKRPQSVEEVRAFLNDSIDNNSKSEPEEENDVTDLGDGKNKNVKGIKEKLGTKILKTKICQLLYLKKNVTYSFIFILVIITIALIMQYIIVPYYNEIQLKDRERRKILQDIEKVDSIVNRAWIIQDSVRSGFCTSFYSEEIGFFEYYGRYSEQNYGNSFGILSMSDSIGVATFKGVALLDNFNPYEWSLVKTQPGLYRLDTIYHKFDSLEIERTFLRYGLTKHDFRIENHGTIDKEDFISDLRSSMIDRLEEIYTGCYVGPFMDNKMEGKNAVFFYDNGDVFVGEFRNNRCYQGEYLVRHALEGEPYYFVGNFESLSPHKGRWYDRNGKRIYTN